MCGSNTCGKWFKWAINAELTYEDAGQNKGWGKGCAVDEFGNGKGKLSGRWFDEKGKGKRMSDLRWFDVKGNGNVNGKGWWQDADMTDHWFDWMGNGTGILEVRANKYTGKGQNTGADVSDILVDGKGINKGKGEDTGADVSDILVDGKGNNRGKGEDTGADVSDVMFVGKGNDTGKGKTIAGQGKTDIWGEALAWAKAQAKHDGTLDHQMRRGKGIHTGEVTSTGGRTDDSNAGNVGTGDVNAGKGSIGSRYGSMARQGRFGGRQAWPTRDVRDVDRADVDRDCS